MSIDERKALAQSLITFNADLTQRKLDGIDRLSRKQRVVYDNLPVMAQNGKRQRQLIANLSLVPVYKHKILFMYNPECRHCQRVKILLNKYVKIQGKSFLLDEMDVTPKEKTDYLMAITKGNLDVPAALIDDTFLIQGENSFLERLTTAIQLADVTPTAKEKEQKWMLR
jgi:hypothetical protein